MGGAWRIELPQAEPAGRRYRDHSAVLETTLRHPARALVVTDGRAQRREGARVLLEQGIGRANDLGLSAEEVDAKSGALLGNLPPGLAHAGFLTAVCDYAAAMQPTGTAGPKHASADRIRS